MYKNLRSLFRELLETPNMLNIKKLKIEYVTNRKGEKTAVIVPIENFEELMEDIEDLAAVAERREEPTISHDQLVAELKQDGLI
jgi:PHD/YefM family antitoxin component YafN of YafNO toxin-antitoxin module